MTCQGFIACRGVRRCGCSGLAVGSADDDGWVGADWVGRWGSLLGWFVDLAWRPAKYFLTLKPHSGQKMSLLLIGFPQLGQKNFWLSIFYSSTQFNSRKMCFAAYWLNWSPCRWGTASRWGKWRWQGEFQQPALNKKCWIFPERLLGPSQRRS